MYKCPVCGKEFDELTLLSQCVKQHAVEEKLAKAKKAQEKKKKEMEDKKALILAAKKDIEKQYEILKGTVNKYNELVESFNKGSAEKFSTYSSSLSSHKSESISNFDIDAFSSLFDFFNWR